MLVVFSMVGACAPKKKKHPAPAPAQSQSPATPPRKGGPFFKITFGDGRGNSTTPECQTKSDTSLDPARKIQRQTINVKMEKQRVIRKDCTGNVTSDKIEKVTMPSSDILLKPAGWWIGQGIGMPYNRTTCTGPGFELERVLLTAVGVGVVDTLADSARNNAGFPSVRFKVDTSPTVGAMHVRKNADNYIDYEFQKCTEKNSEGACSKTESLEKGTLILTVNYTENLDIGGVKEVPAIDCPPTSPPGRPLTLR
jgi:hypothetical protein